MSESRVKIVSFLVESTRLLVGATFLFSGFVKAIDPHGFAYKIEDYSIEFQFVELFPLLCRRPFSWWLPSLPWRYASTGNLQEVDAWLLGYLCSSIPLTLYRATNPVEDWVALATHSSSATGRLLQIWYLLGTLFLLLNWRRMKPLFSCKAAPLVAIFTVVFGFLLALQPVSLPHHGFQALPCGCQYPGADAGGPGKGRPA